MCPALVSGTPPRNRLRFKLPDESEQPVQLVRAVFSG